MSKGRRVGVFGGTFDPIHVGGLAAVDDAADALDLDVVLFVPNREPPHKDISTVTPVGDRVAMVRLAIEDNPHFRLSTVELDRAGPSYTLDTMRQLTTQYPGMQLVFLTGCDSLNNLYTWHEPEALLEEFRFVVMDRPTGKAIDWPAVERHFPRMRDRVEVISVARLEISGRDIRQRIREGRPFRYFLPRSVATYIEDHSLYR